MTPYPSEGTFTSESREVAVSETWDTWANPQSSSNVEVVDGSLQLAESDTPHSDLLHAHYDFSEEDGSTPVTDQSGNGHALDQGQYTGVGESINGVQAGEFDGTDDGLWGPTFSDIRPASVFAVVRYDEGSGGDGNIVTPNDTENVIFGWSSTTATWRTYLGSGIEGSSDTSSQLVGTVIDGSNSVLREDGGQTGGGDPGSFAFNAIGVGSGEPERSSGREWEGAIGEVLVYETALSSSQIGDVESHLADKWGVSI